MRVGQSELQQQAVEVAGRVGDDSLESVQRWLDEYEQRRHLKDLSKSHNQRSIRELRKAAKRLGWQKLSDITTSSIVGYLAWYKDQKRGPKTRNLIRSYMHGFCEMLVNERARTSFATNPVNSVPKATVKHRIRYIPATMEEKNRLVDVVLADHRKKDRWLLYELGWWTGLRLGVLLRLTWHQVRLDDAMPHIAVPGDWQKNGLPIRCELPASVAEMLRKHKSLAGGRQTVLAIRGLKPQHFDRDLAKAGLAKRDDSTGERRSFYSLRHGFQEMMRREGLDISARRLAMGHSTINMTADVYSHPSSNELRSVIDRVDARSQSHPPAPVKKNGASVSCGNGEGVYSDSFRLSTGPVGVAMFGCKEQHPAGPTAGRYGLNNRASPVGSAACSSDNLSDNPRLADLCRRYRMARKEPGQPPSASIVCSVTSGIRRE